MHKCVVHKSIDIGISFLKEGELIKQLFPYKKY